MGDGSLLLGRFMANGLRLTHWTGRNPGHSAIVVCISCWRAVALNDVLHFVHCRQNGLSCKGWGKCRGLLLPCFYDSIIGHTTSRLTVGTVGGDSNGLYLNKFYNKHILLTYYTIHFSATFFSFYHPRPQPSVSYICNIK